MNTLNMASMTGTGGSWGMDAGMGLHGVVWLILLLAAGTAVWLLVQAAGRTLVNRRQ